MCPTTINVENLDQCPVCEMQWKYMVDCNQCKGTGKDADGNVCNVHHSCKHEGLDFCADRECSAHCCKNGQRGPFSHLVGMEYPYGSPERYDGVSEWFCPSCETRWGRWTGKVLTDGQVEPRFGGQ